MKRYVLSFVLMTALGLLSMQAAEPVKVTIDFEPHKDWTINPMLFGSFSEEHWGDITPGIYEQYVVNPSFEDWYVKKEGDREPEEKSNVVWKDIPKVEGVAFPWEKLTSGNSAVELTSDGFNTSLAQRLKVSQADTAIVYQRLALPCYRVRSFNISFYAKVTGNACLKVFMTTMNLKNVLDERVITSATDKWQRFDVTFHIPKLPEVHMRKYSVCNLGFEVTGDGAADLDLVTLFPVDCHDGIYNPETIAYFKDYHPTMVRWPGGNFTSGYHWYDGIGKFEDRRTLPNLAWGSLCTNHVGIDEFLRFCELTDIEPLMGVGFDDGVITPKEVADWVEYCNGDTTTPMGKLRAENGHPEPYNVKYWGVGNEVYGPYQIGHTDAAFYATGLVEIATQMRKVDPSIKIIACAYGVHNTHRNPSAEWTRTVVRIAGDHIDYLDAHAYVYGPKGSELGDVRRPDVIRAFAASNYFLDGYIDSVRQILKEERMEHIGLSFLEWGILPRIGRSKSTRVPHRQTFVNMLCTAAYFNEFIRNGDFVHMGAHHNFSFYVQPNYAHGERVNPRTLLYKHYGQMAGGKVLDMKFENMPVYDVTTDWQTIGSPTNVPEVDMLAVRKGKRVFVTLMNRNHNDSYTLNLDFLSGKVKRITGNTYTSDKPFEPLTWQNRKDVGGHVKKNAVLTVSSDYTASVTIPKISHTLLIIDLQ